MHSLRTPLAVAFAALTLFAQGAAVAAEPAVQKDQAIAARPQIQLAILLDTSGSMSGLINQARTQLWKIVNELATAKRGGQVPELAVALYEYGNNGLSMQKGYIRQIVDFTDDLDRISEELFALTTNGGQEYCGQVIDAAVKELPWSGSDLDLKLIFIAGNEPFSQGHVDYRNACKAAVEQGITVNTIFCGPLSEGVRTGWQAGALLADGSFFNINQDRQVAVVTTPFDKDLARLSGEINATYLAFGDVTARRRFLARQSAQDSLAEAAAPAAAAERATFKGSHQYKASAWDLIDALADGRVNLEEVKQNELPEKMQKMSLAEKKEFLNQKSKQREKIREQLKSLGEQRKKHIAEQQKKEAAGGEQDTLGTAIINSIRDQAGVKKFQFGDE